MEDNGGKKHFSFAWWQMARWHPLKVVLYGTVVELTLSF